MTSPAEALKALEIIEEQIESARHSRKPGVVHLSIIDAQAIRTALSSDAGAGLKRFVESIGDATGPYPDLDGHKIVRDSRKALATIKQAPSESGGWRDEIESLKKENARLLRSIAKCPECGIHEALDRTFSSERW